MNKTKINTFSNLVNFFYYIIQKFEIIDIFQFDSYYANMHFRRMEHVIKSEDIFRFTGNLTDITGLYNY